MAINPTPASLPIETLVNGRFRVKKLLGYGGYGNVYLVEDELRSKNKYALKESLSTTTSERRQFSRESKWLMKLKHPNLPEVRDEFEWNGRLYYIMDYIEGENLEDRVDTFGALPEQQVLGWIRPIGEAIVYLHNQKPAIIHRDIKPGNIIVTRDGRPYLVDFGIAKQVQRGSSRKTTRAARAVSGGYSPLEQYTRGGTDARSDVYALGSTLYHLLTGICPPEAPDIASGVVRLPEPRQIHSRISKQSEQVIMRAMNQKPDERFQSVRDLLDALPGSASASASVPAAAQPTTTSSRRGRGKGQKASASDPTLVGAAALHAAPPSASYQGGTPAGAYISPPNPRAHLPPAPAPAAAAPAATPAQPGQPAQPGAPAYQAPPQALPSAPAGKQPNPRQTVVLVGFVALLCGLAVLASITLNIAAYAQNGQTNTNLPFYITQYTQLTTKDKDWWVYPLLALVPLAGLALLALPITHWLRMIGPRFTFFLLILTSLLGLAATIAWVQVIANQSPPTDLLTTLFAQGFFIPILLFALPVLTMVARLFRRRKARTTP
jgi:serine/threonine protein kinase